MANYFGAPQPQHHYGVAEAVPRAKRRQPSRLNFAAIVLCLFVPWALFCIMYAVMSFSMHYKDKLLCYLCVLMGLVFVLMMFKLAMDSVQKHTYDQPHDPSWFLFLAFACFIAWVAGVALGDMNYHYNMEPYYDVNTLNTYPDVDPRMSGQMLMDAGRFTFKKGSRLAFNYSMAFKNLDSYCVVPVVMNQTGPLPTYDFWAVGLNCCSGDKGSFGCGEYNNPHAMSGLRVMRGDQRAFYRLAVQQAEASYNIRAPHPLFFYWMQDPVAEMHAYMDEGYKYYICGVFTFFAALLFFIIVAMVLFSKMGN